MNANDWIAATGSAIVRGGPGGFKRPINPRLLASLRTKALPTKSTASTRQSRRLIYRAAKLTGEVDDLLSPMAQRRRARATTRSPSIEEQSAPGAAGAAARLKHAAIVQRWRK
jgi:hypothetical protein